MYKPSLIGPWPIVDPSQALDSFSTSVTATEWSALGATLKPRLDTQNLGTKHEAYTNNIWTGTASATSAAVGDHLSFGVCLQPLINVSNGQPTYVDINMSMAGPFGSATTIFQPWIGFIDSASATLADGWDATHNVVTDYCPLGDWGAQVYDYTYGLNTQVLLKDIVSGGLNTDKFVCVGFSMIRTTTVGFTGCRYQIGARYAYKPIGTSYTGV